MRKLTLTGLGMIVGACLVFAACGGDDDTISVPGGGEISISEDKPDNFPDDFPLPDGADSLGSYSGGADGQEGTVATFSTDDSAEDVEAFYDEEFENGPWTLTSQSNVSGLGTYAVENGDTAAFVAVQEVSGETTIIITYGSKDDFGVDGSDSDSSDDDSSSDDESSDDGSSDDESSSDNGSSDEESSSDDGSDDSSSSAELPDEVDLQEDYPVDEVPIPDDSTVTSSNSFSSGGFSTISAEIYSRKTAEELKSHYEDALTGAGYTEALSSNSNGETFLSYNKGELGATDTETVFVTITESPVDGYRLVSVTLSGGGGE